MEFNTTFSIVARCKKFNKSEAGEPITEDIVLMFNEVAAASILFKFGPDAFAFGQYKVLLKYNEKHNLTCITLHKDDDMYIISNHNQVLNDIHDGYIRLKVMDKLNDIMSFDFKAALDIIDPPVDEFEE